MCTHPSCLLPPLGGSSLPICGKCVSYQTIPFVERSGPWKWGRRSSHTVYDCRVFPLPLHGGGATSPSLVTMPQLWEVYFICGPNQHLWCPLLLSHHGIPPPSSLTGEGGRLAKQPNYTGEVFSIVPAYGSICSIIVPNAASHTQYG